MTSATRGPHSYRADPAVPSFPDDRPLIVYDGVCVMCSGWVQFILRHDRRGLFRFADAASPLGQALFRHYGLKTHDYESYVMLENGRALLRSDPSLTILQRLGWPWAAAGVFKFVPRFLRDRVYDWVARNRYRILGKRETCWLPDPAVRERFLS